MILYYGPVGVGNPHMAHALGHLAVRARADVRFTKTSRALAELAGGACRRHLDPPAAHAMLRDRTPYRPTESEPEPLAA